MSSAVTSAATWSAGRGRHGRGRHGRGRHGVVGTDVVGTRRGRHARGRHARGRHDVVVGTLVVGTLVVGTLVVGTLVVGTWSHGGRHRSGRHVVVGTLVGRRRRSAGARRPGVTLDEDRVHVVVGLLPRAGGHAVAVAVDPLKCGERPGGLGQPIPQRTGVGCVHSAGRDVRRDVFLAGRDRHRLGKPDRHPARELEEARGLLGQETTRTGPQLHRVRTGIAPGPVELDAADRARTIGREPDTDRRPPVVREGGDLGDDVVGPDAVLLGARRRPRSPVPLGHGGHRRHGTTDGQSEGEDDDRRCPASGAHANGSDRRPVPGDAATLSLAADHGVTVPPSIHVFPSQAFPGAEGSKSITGP